MQCGDSSQPPHASIAQLVEHRFCKAGVVGSSPTRGSDNIIPSKASYRVIP